VPAVAATELSEDTLLLDVREADEWARGRAVGAVHLPMSEITTRLDEIPRDRDLVIVCHVGNRSARVTLWLQQQGVGCRNLTGGMVAYAAAGLPLESDTGSPVVD
jgi:rhodanese-related sulfurtransferase